MKAIREHLREIRADLIGSMQQDENGPYWVTPYYDKISDSFLYQEYKEIFNGDCGIALFFIALFELDHEVEDLALATKIIDRVLQTIQPRFYCFYTGVTGVVYCLVRLYEITPDKKYLTDALKLLRTHRDGIVINMNEMDLLGGAAGNLLVLTLLFHHTAEEDVLQDIHTLIDHFLTDARISKQGLKWDHNKLAYDSLAGFSHGASGIAYALMQVGTYFSYEGLIYLGREALKYEMQYYDEKIFNWYDLRLGAQRFNLQGAHTWNLDIFLPALKPVNSWAHGAAGIGIARKYAWSITNDAEYKVQYQQCIQRCLEDVKTKREDYTLCSGYAGMVTFLLPDKEIVTQIAADTVELYKRTGTYNTFISANSTDMGLLSGRAGIGYMLIDILTEGKMKNVLHLQLPVARQSITPRYSTLTVKEILYKKYYKRTYAILNNSSVTFIRNVFRYEKLIRSIWQRHKGYLCYYKMNDHLNKVAAQLDDHLLLSAIYMIPDHITLTHTSFNPEQPAEGQGIFAVLIEMNSTGIRELCIGRLAELIIRNLNEPHSGRDLIGIISAEILADEKLIKEKVLLQLKELVKSRIITYRMQH